MTTTPSMDALITVPVREILATVHRDLEPRRRVLLRQRQERADRPSAGDDLGPLKEAASLRADETWQVSAAPADLARRTVELAGPATAQQARVVLSSGADTWVADLEDALVPTWEQLRGAHRAIGDYVRHTGPDVPTLIVRPRGLHLEEAHLRVDGAHVAASLVDTALFVAHQGRALLERGSAPYLYLPKLEHHDEASWWDDLLGLLEDLLGLPRHTVRVSVLIETAPAVDQLEEILYALCHRVTALSAGRYDYVASYLHRYAEAPDRVLPDRDALTMSTRFLRTYTELIVQTCRRRGVAAIGGPVADVPRGSGDEATHRAMARVRRDKGREADQGFAGAWVLHPALVPVARQAFAGRRSPHCEQASTAPTAPEPPLLTDAEGPCGSPTLTGLRSNVRCALYYLTGWLGGRGTCEIDGHLEDFGTVELARMQVWQWAHHAVPLAEGPRVTHLLLERLLSEEIAILRRRRPAESTHIEQAGQLLRESFAQRQPSAYLSPAAYAVLLRHGTNAAAASAA